MTEPPERGAASILVIGLFATAALLISLVLGLGVATTARHRAAAAADLAALAAVDSGEGCTAAARIAHSNRGRLLACRSGPAGTVEVRVEVDVPFPGGVARGTARAGPGPVESRTWRPPEVPEPTAGSPVRTTISPVHHIGDTEWAAWALGVTDR